MVSDRLVAPMEPVAVPETGQSQAAVVSLGVSFVATAAPYSLQGRAPTYIYRLIVGKPLLCSEERTCDENNRLNIITRLTRGFSATHVF